MLQELSSSCTAASSSRYKYMLVSLLLLFFVKPGRTDVTAGWEPGLKASGPANEIWRLTLVNPRGVSTTAVWLSSATGSWPVPTCLFILPFLHASLLACLAGVCQCARHTEPRNYVSDNKDKRCFICVAASSSSSSTVAGEHERKLGAEGTRPSFLLSQHNKILRSVYLKLLAVRWPVGRLIRLRKMGRIAAGVKQRTEGDYEGWQNWGFHARIKG